MISLVWHQISVTFLSKFARFEQLVGSCYSSNEKIGITQEEVVDIFAQLLPTAAATAAAGGAGAGAGRPSQSVESSRNR